MFIKQIKQNWQAGLAVALVSIPLAISLAVASKATPTAGIITAVWAGLVAALFGGSNFNIIGPTGALSGIIASYAFIHGASSVAFLTIITGCFIIIAYAIKLERYLIFIPSSVIHGFTLGVAFIIGLNQLNFALGLKNLAPHEHLFQNVIETCNHISDISLSALVVFLVFLIGLFMLRLLTPKIPGAILLTPIGILLGYASKTNTVPIALETLGEKFSDIAFKLFVKPDFSWQSHMLQTAAVVALIAILETLLSAKIADGMTHTKHNPRKEMLGLGLANVVSGLMGGIPATAALARTSLNIKAHATHKTAAALSTIFIALISFFLLSYFSYIPMAVIAAILMYVSIQMVEAEHFVPFFKYERANFWIALLVAFVTIYKDPIAGILLGATISLLLLVHKISQGHYEITTAQSTHELIDSSGEKLKEIDKNAQVLMYSLKGKLCYINGRAHVTRFEANLQKYTYIIVRLREIYFIDLDGVEALDEIIETAHKRKQKILLAEVPVHMIKLLEETSSGYQHLKKQNLIFKTTRDALSYIITHYPVTLS